MTVVSKPLRAALADSVQRIGAAITSRYPENPQPLAEPPAGSGLRPVMGSYGFPGIGHAVESMASPLAYPREQYRRYGPVSWTGAVGFRVVTVMGPDALQQVWLDRNKVFSSERGWRPVIGPFFHRGLMLLDFDEHLFHRRIMQQAFTRPRLNDYLEATWPLVDRTLRSWTPGQRFHMYDHAKQLLLDLACQVFVGESPTSSAARQLSEAFDDAVHGGQAMIRYPVPGGAWSRGLTGRRFLKSYFRNRVATRRAGNGTDLFSVLCKVESDDGAVFTDDDIVNHMIFLLMAAHDTSTIALSMMAYHIGKDQPLQTALREEARSLPDTPSIEQLNEPTLLDMAFKETLRMHAPAGTLFRQATADTEILGHYIPANTQVALNLHASMRLQQWWPNPDTFDPYRFQDPNSVKELHGYAWSPFGAGAHKCIGMHFGGLTVKAAMHQLLRRYRWSVPADYTPLMTWGTGPTPADGLPVTLQPHTN
ncbi:cytochrome P450 [Haloechinothrix sp. YIM 98757]|uniref:Cytochrome P450 n=2 Tax=Haloechinothrix aidingensis TaxID=2752311 RepID=A0A838AEX6_9PSEU|nr:cytochrome P450 [Haloechinothrix aidingensis]